LIGSSEDLGSTLFKMCLGSAHAIHADAKGVSADRPVDHAEGNEEACDAEEHCRQIGGLPFPSPPDLVRRVVVGLVWI
jgi:hypothetical protein